MADTAALARRRYRLLLDQLRAEWEREHVGKTRGFPAHAARKLGVSPEYIKMILDGTRDAAPVEQAMETMGLSAAFFYDPSDRDPHYTEYLLTRTHRELPEMAGVTRYFTRNPHHERFRAAVNRHLNASVGDVSYDLVKAVVRGLEDAEAAESETRM